MSANITNDPRRRSGEYLIRGILAAATRALWVWLVYGIVEFVLACGLPVLFQSDVELLEWQWRPLALVFGVYALAGVVLGGAAGGLVAFGMRHANCGSSRPYNLTAALTLVVAFVANLISAWPLRPSEYIALAIAVLLSVLFAGAVASNVWLERIGFLANPWGVSLLLLTTPWVSRVALAHHSTTLKTGVSLLVVGVIVTVAAGWDRLRSGHIGPSRRRAVMVSAATFLLFGGVLVSKTDPAVHTYLNNGAIRSGKCNVLLITMDTVRADHLSLYGYERDTTPHLRDLAHEATVYTRAIAAADMTLPAHASIFTGLYPSWHGAYFAPPDYPWGRPLAARYATLAEVLRAHGYWTAAEVANYGFLGPWLGLAKGFAIYDSHRPMRLFELPGESSRPFYLREGARRLLNLVVDTSAFDERVLRAADINRHAFAFLNGVKQDSRFFLFLNYMDSHAPYIVPSPFNTRFPGRDAHFKAIAFGDVSLAVNSGKHHLSVAERSHVVSQYDGGIVYEDDEIGKLLTRLRELGLYENTLIIVTSDHGEAFGDRDLAGHALGSVYQDQVHVPLIIKYPGQHEAQQSDDLVSHVDLMPTVLDFAGISPPSGVQGRSLRLPRTEDSDAVYSQATARTWLLPINPRFRGVRYAIFSASWKLITWTEGPAELYDLESDPGETRNLHRAGEPRVRALEDRLSRWMAGAPHNIEQPRKLDKNSMERLKSLGYVQ